TLISWTTTFLTMSRGQLSITGRQARVPWRDPPNPIQRSTPHNDMRSKRDEFQVANRLLKPAGGRHRRRYARTAYRADVRRTRCAGEDLRPGRSATPRCGRFRVAEPSRAGRSAHWYCPGPGFGRG